MYLPTWYRSVEAYVDLNTVIDGSTGTLSCGTDSCVALRTNAPLRTCLFCKSYVWYLDPLCIYPTPHLHPLCGRAFSGILHLHPHLHPTCGYRILGGSAYEQFDLPMPFMLVDCKMAFVGITTCTSRIIPIPEACRLIEYSRNVGRLARWLEHLEVDIAQLQIT